MIWEREELDHLHDLLDLDRSELSMAIKAKIPPPMPEWRRVSRNGPEGIYEWMEGTRVRVVVEGGVLCEIEFQSDEPLDLEEIGYFPLDDIIKDMT